MAKRYAIRFRWSATVMPKRTTASSTIMKIPSRLNGARSLKSTNSTIRPSMSPVSASIRNATTNQSRTASGIFAFVSVWGVTQGS